MFSVAAGKAAPVSMAELTAPSSSSAAAATAGSSAAAEAGDEDGSAQGTLYIKNLAFATTDESLKKHFDKVRTPGLGQRGRRGFWMQGLTARWLGRLFLCVLVWWQMEHALGCEVV